MSDPIRTVDPKTYAAPRSFVLYFVKYPTDMKASLLCLKDILYKEIVGAWLFRLPFSGSHCSYTMLSMHCKDYICISYSGHKTTLIFPIAEDATRFKPLRKYVYSYEAETSSGITGTADSRSGSKITCKVGKEQ